MHVSDAVDKCEDDGLPYLIFKNIETDKMNVLVKKDEDHYRLLEP